MARKRKNGQGTVRLRSDGRWEGRHIVGYDENGKAKQKSVLAKTKAECVEKLKKLQEEYTEVASFKVKPDMRFGDWINYWYENHCKPSIRPTTQKGYEEWIYVHAIPGLGHIPLNKLTQADCQKFLNEMKANGRKTHRDTKGPEMAERSVRSCYHVIRMALDRAIKDGLIKKNPILGVKLPPPEPKEMKVLSKEEIQRFLIQAKAEGMYELFLLELTTGLRRGEILALTWDDLNFETGELRISKQVTPVGGKNIISEPKTKAAFRTIILPPAMAALLREYRKEVFSSLMFPSRIKPDQPIDPGYVRKRLQQILERADCKRVRFHDLRHPYVKHTTKIFSLRSMAFQAQAYPDARRKTRGACQLHRGGQSRSPVRPLCNRKRFSCLPPQSKMSRILYAISMRLSGYTSTRSISSSASSVVSVSASKIALDASLRLSCRACSSCFCFACANTAA